MLASIRFFHDVPDWRAEADAARGAGFSIVDHHKCDGLLVPRYSLGAHREQFEGEMRRNRQRFVQHTLAYTDWWNNPALREFTPLTWGSMAEIPESAYPVIIKGRIKSRKEAWPRLMYAENPQEARRITEALLDDTIIGGQGLIYRKWEPFEVIEEREVGPPAINEWRVLMYGLTVLGSGYYWPGIECEPPPQPALLETFARGLAHRLKLEVEQFHAWTPELTCFDIGVSKDNGQLRLIEVNDGRMAGLSTIPPELFYVNLFQALRAVEPPKSLECAWCGYHPCMCDQQ